MQSNERHFFIAERSRKHYSNPMKYMLERIDFLRYKIVKVQFPRSDGWISYREDCIQEKIHKAKLDEMGYHIRPLTSGEVFLIEL